MELNHLDICGHRLCYLSVSLFFLLISSSTQFRFIAEGRRILRQSDSYPNQIVREGKTIARAQMGSRPPRCVIRCSSCGHCEPIQVPTNPQARNGNRNSSTLSRIAYARGDDNSNYKPMSWKCKCGNLIFNP
ncbi:EPIDERMAL PATTERNING FACTOR-like protein 2 [Quillaja saponaria]|uniref:Epidermal patterning factor-like protein n=1 Tax=Quillaja saponaria TaxID=32244 RepID=A0AAD7P701_QUISA|nr:EPIDERMAL PATTERNING FACTOR-like protein 2 [Quillaja saponaria]